MLQTEPEMLTFLFGKRQLLGLCDPSLSTRLCNACACVCIHLHMHSYMYRSHYQFSTPQYNVRKRGNVTDSCSLGTEGRMNVLTSRTCSNLCPIHQPDCFYQIRKLCYYPASILVKCLLLRGPKQLRKEKDYS